MPEKLLNVIIHAFAIGIITESGAQQLSNGHVVIGVCYFIFAISYWIHFLLD